MSLLISAKIKSEGCVASSLKLFEAEEVWVRRKLFWSKIYTRKGSEGSVVSGLATILNVNEKVVPVVITLFWLETRICRLSSAYKLQSRFFVNLSKPWQLWNVNERRLDCWEPGIVTSIISSSYMGSGLWSEIVTSDSAPTTTLLWFNCVKFIKLKSVGGNIL